jgi:hypothetical protein
MVSAEGALTYVDGAAGIPRHADRMRARGGAEQPCTPRATVSTWSRSLRNRAIESGGGASGIGTNSPV